MCVCVCVVVWAQNTKTMGYEVSVPRTKNGLSVARPKSHVK